MSRLVVNYTIFGLLYSWDACSFIKGIFGRMGMGKRGRGRGNWEEWREGKIPSECNT